MLTTQLLPNVNAKSKIESLRMEFPSDDANPFYKNKICDYRIEFPKRISFPCKFEAALLEFSYPFTWYDCPEEVELYVLVPCNVAPRVLHVFNETTLSEFKLNLGYTNAVFNKFTSLDELNSEMVNLGIVPKTNINLIYPIYRQVICCEVNNNKGDIIEKIYFGSRYIDRIRQTIHNLEQTPRDYSNILKLYQKPDEKIDAEYIAYTNPENLPNYSPLAAAYKVVNIKIPRGSYLNPLDLWKMIIREVNLFIEDYYSDFDKNAGFLVDEINGSNVIRLRPKNIRGNIFHILTKSQLHVEKLGFDSKKIPVNFYGYYDIMINGVMDIIPKPCIVTPTLYIYCDFIEEQFVGHKMIKVIRQIPVPSDEKRNTMIREIFLLPYFCKVWSNSISSVRISICNHLGHLIPFETGRVSATILFQPVYDQN
jgi:hypothetical protein